MKGWGWIAAAIALSGCATDISHMAPEPVKPIDEARFYTGRWYEIARTPEKLTQDCVAGTTDFYGDSRGRLIDRDACRMGSPGGMEKAYAGPVSILNPGLNNKITVHYAAFGFISAARSYWILDHGTDYDWFIVSNPQFTQVSIFTRVPQPSRDKLESLLERTRSLGYYTGKLEFPEQFPATVP